ncbi:helix-turn-helix transcriptional regulator [Faecalibaculum rodentium]|uniref:helix-turn-helix transcriptional regulator n=1 Tax=Faecalibaculum rodentium TaxID=1702221 RepID=UPI0026F3F8B7|nr:helix-turn-helix transcriptional regulator [Faecalibaculum rodentium]
MDDFGERLRRLRLSRDLSQGELASRLGVVPSSVGKYERIANSFPSVEVLIKISDFFDVTLDYLLKGTEATPSVENNISGLLSNSPFIQANHGGMVINGENRSLSPETVELLRIYETLGGRDRLKLLNFAVELEEGGTA